MGRQFEKPVFLVLLGGITLLFLYLLKPFFGPIFWACAVAVVFSPLQARFVRLTRGRENLSAAMSLAVALAICVVPLGFVVRSLYCEGAALIGALKTNSFDFTRYIDAVTSRMPAVTNGLGHVGVDVGDMGRYANEAAKGLVDAAPGKAIDVVNWSFGLVAGIAILLYVLFFMLRDGPGLARTLMKVLPIADDSERVIGNRFAQVVRATIKGTLVVAAVQGTLGGIIFAILGIRGPVLWGAVMGLLSMIPVVGTGLVWGPAAIYLIITDRVAKGIILLAYGIVVIGLSDNLIRPILVGRETRMPDYVVLLSTLGGIAVFGINGIIIGPLVAALFIAFWDIFARDYTRKPD